MNNQGKRQDQYENSAKFAWYAIVGMILLLILVTLFSGCAVTKEQPQDKCCKVKNEVIVPHDPANN